MLQGKYARTVFTPPSPAEGGGGGDLRTSCSRFREMQKRIRAEIPYKALLHFLEVSRKTRNNIGNKSWNIGYGLGATP